MDQHTFAEDIYVAIDPALTAARYNRTWRFSRPRTVEDEFLVGKLGFTSVATETRTDYDETLKDFVEQNLPARQGHYVQWALDLSSQIMAFETKPPDIKAQSFVGAFEGLLDHRPDLALTIEYIRESAKFYEWAEQMDRISRFRAVLRAPNPDFADLPRSIRNLLEGPNADRATVELGKEPGSTESLEIKDTMIQEMVEYGQRGYSTVVARGAKNGRQRVFDSKRTVASEQVEIPDVAGVGAIWEALVEILSKMRR